MRFLRRAAALLYRTLLLRYPRRFRREYGAEMWADFARALDVAARRAGVLGAARVLARATVDLLRPLPRLRTDRATPGTRGASARRERTAGVTGPLRPGAASARVLHDVRLAFRSLAREPRFTALAVGVLGIGIALFAAVLAVVNAYLIRPLPFPEADRIVSVQGTWGAVGWTEVDELFDLAASWDLDVFILTGDGAAELRNGAWITPDFLEMYGVRPALGRRFRPDEAGQGGPQVAMISHRLWQQRFGGDPRVLGRSFRAYTSDRPDHAEAFTVVGVLPEDFWYLNAYTDVLVPLREDRALYAGRLRPGVLPGRAAEVLTAMAAPRLDPLPDGFRVRVERIQDVHAEAVRPTLVLFQTAVLLVLLIAGANTAVLLLVRAARRQRELGVRRALGATRWRLAVQLAAEGLVLAVGAAAVGSILAWGALHVLGEGMQAHLGRSVPGGPEALRLDGFVVLATAGLGCLVGAAVGLVPLFASGRDSALGRLLGSGARGGESAVARRFRGAMVGTEVAISLALLVTAGLVTRSAVHLSRRDLGFAPEGLERGVVGLRAASYPTVVERASFFDALTERVRDLPSVEAAGLVSAAPFTTRFNTRELEAESGSTAEGTVLRAGDGYVAALGSRILRGRDLAATDRTGAVPVALVTERLAQALWPDGEPIGRRVRATATAMNDGPSEWYTVIGVAGDVVREVEGPDEGALLVSYRQSDTRWMNVVVRVRPGAPSVMPQVAEILADLDRDVPLSSVTWLMDAVDRSLAPIRFTARLLGGFALLASVLALIGLFGVVSYAARRSRRDVAIRLALGAPRAAAALPLIRQGARVVSAGMLLGGVVSVPLARLVEGQLYGVPAFDPVTLSVAVAALLAIAAGAIAVPARAVARAHPMGVLREE